MKIEKKISHKFSIQIFFDQFEPYFFLSTLSFFEVVGIFVKFITQSKRFIILCKYKGRYKADIQQKFNFLKKNHKVPDRILLYY